MTTISGSDPNVTYKAILTCGVTSLTSASGVTSSVQPVQDAQGNSSALSISTVQVNCANFTFNGNTINLTSGAAVFTPNITFGGNITVTGTSTFNGAITGLTITNPVNVGSFALTLGGTTTFGGAVSTSGTFTITGSTYNFTGTLTANTSITFPTSGTLVNTDVTTLTSLTTANALTSASTLATIGTVTTGVWNGTGLTVPYGGTGLASATAYAVLLGGTTSTGAFQSIASVGTSGQVLTSNGAGAKPTFQNSSGVLVQRVHTAITGTNGTSSIPADNTIPQISEGTSFASLAITPINSANLLVVVVNTPVGKSNSNSTAIYSMFQDSTANALSARIKSFFSGNDQEYITWVYEMTAGTTSSTTFSCRVGTADTGTWYISSSQPNYTLGGTQVGYMDIYEYTQ